MSGILRGAGLGLLLLFLVVLLREAGFRGARLLSLIGTVGLVGLSVTGIGGIFERLNLSSYLAGGEELFVTVVRILGVGIAFGITADACRDMGEAGVSGAVLMLGRVEIFALTVPYIGELLDLARGYLGQ